MVKLYLPLKVNLGQKINNTAELDTLYVESKFGRTPLYLLLDTTTGERRIIENTNHHFGGNDSPPAIAINNGADAVLASHLGSRPYAGLKNAGIPVYLVDSNTSIDQLVKLYKSGDLSIMDEPGPGTCCSGRNHSHQV